MKKNDYLNDYLDYLKYQKGYSEYTIENYKNDILEFFKYLEREKIDYLKIEYSDTRFYLMYLKDECKNNNTTIDRKLSSLRGFYKYLSKNNYVENNVFMLLAGPKKDKKLPRYFEYNELEELFDSIDTTDSIGQRDLLILELLYATGVRVGELVNIQIKDINQRERTIRILGKGNKERIVSYGEYCEDILNQYLSYGRIELNKKGNDYLLLNNIHIGRIILKIVFFITLIIIF